MEEGDADATIDETKELDIVATALDNASDCVGDELGAGKPLLVAASDELDPAPTIPLLGLVIDVVKLDVAVEELMLTTEAVPP